MSASHPTLRGCSSRSRGRGRRRYSDRSGPPPSAAVVSGDSNFQSVRDTNSSLQHRHHHHPYRNNDNNKGNQFRRLDYKPRSSPSIQNPNLNPDRSMTNTRPLDYRIWEFAKPPPPPNAERFVVLSYNILADYLANSHRHLYYHIPHRFMSWDWRKKNILFELGLWSADIMCLQEVDKFDELEEGLRGRGYSGVWKMRTGDPIDGCAIFWRTSRFKLVYEECIEFNKLSMRDNVAQICVLESLNENQSRSKKLASSESTESHNRVVICNIHVLYNPRRGDIKLGQIRVLLERAEAVSKKWDNASVVLCGDFNCVPKSPLYNFILGQKLDISELGRANISGQASADRRQSPRQYGDQTRGQSSGAITSSSVIQNLNVEKRMTSANNQTAAESILENPPTKKRSSHFSSESPLKFSLLGVSEKYSKDFHVDSDENTSRNVYTDNTKDEGNSTESDKNTNEETSAESENLNNEMILQLVYAMPGVLDDPLFTRDSENLKKPPYVPSSWTPMEIATATGNANNTAIENSIKLRSTYTEVQDRLGTRDSNGEPLVTSYHSCFMGTVDYIWRSEGLRTVKVLAPIPKSAMLPTKGFPSKKWSSDHIALASELAFSR